MAFFRILAALIGLTVLTATEVKGQPFQWFLAGQDTNTSGLGTNAGKGYFQIFTSGDMVNWNLYADKITNYFYNVTTLSTNSPSAQFYSVRFVLVTAASTNGTTNAASVLSQPAILLPSQINQPNRSNVFVPDLTTSSAPGMLPINVPPAGSGGGGGTFNPTTGTLPVNGGGVWNDSPLSSGNPYTVTLSANQNNDPSLILLQNMTNVSSQGTIIIKATDSDGSQTLTDILGLEDGGWDVGNPSGRMGEISIRTLHSNTMYPRLLIKGSDGSVTFRNEDNSATILNIANSSGWDGSGTHALFDDGTFKTESSPWTNSSGFIYPSGTTLSNTAPFEFNQGTASLFVGTNVWQDAFPVDTTVIQFPYVLSMTASNEPSHIQANWTVTDSEAFSSFARAIIDVNGGNVSVQLNNSAGDNMIMSTANGLFTPDPGNGSENWKLGDIHAGAVVMDTNNSVQVKIGASVVKLLIAK